MILATVAEEQISGIKGGIESQSLANQSSQEDLFMEDTEHQRISIMNTYNSDPEISFDAVPNPRVQQLIESTETLVTTKTRVCSQTLVTPSAPVSPCKPISSKRTITKNDRDKEFAMINDWNKQQIELLNNINTTLSNLLELKKAKYAALGIVTFVNQTPNK